MSEARKDSAIGRLVKAATKVEPNEMTATLLSFLFVFVLMTAYFILRPVRDALSSDWSDEQLSWLWTSTFVFSLIAVSIYGAVISRVRFRIIVPSVYAFFAATFIGFYVAGSTLGDNDLVNRAYYVWLSVFSLYHLSVFWTFMSGLYNKEQAKRLFSIIAMGASAGAIVGPSIPTFFADNIGTLNLLLIAAFLLLIPIPLIWKLEQLRSSQLGNEDVSADLSGDQKLAGNPFSGFSNFVSNPYLLAIGLFILLYVVMNTFIYFELRKMMGGFRSRGSHPDMGRHRSCGQLIGARHRIVCNGAPGYARGHVRHPGVDSADDGWRLARCCAESGTRRPGWSTDYAPRR